MNYKQYLKTPEWTEYAKQERRRAGYRCQRCKVYGKRLSVNRTDRRGTKLPQPGSTLVLCDICTKARWESEEAGP